MKRLRPGVAFILRNSLKEILICERADHPGTWQFPQGGINRGETPLAALVREVQEELGIGPSAYRIVETRGPYGYSFHGLRKKEGYDGQEHTYFLADATGDFPHGLPDVTNVDFPEFRSARWVSPGDFQLTWLPEIKRDVYRRVLSDFFPDSQSALP